MYFLTSNHNFLPILDPSSPLQTQADVIFLIDSSSGTSLQDYKLEKQFVKSLAYHWNLSPNGPRGGAVHYADTSRTVSRFEDSDFNQNLDNAKRLTGSMRIGQALDHAAQLFASSSRNNEKLVILLTAGREAPGSRSLEEAMRPLRWLGAQVYVVAIGQQPSNQVLAPIVARQQDIFRVSSIGRLLSQARSTAQTIRDASGKD